MRHLWTLLPLVVIGCASWAEMRENMASPEATDALSYAIGQFSGGDWIGGIASVVGLAGVVFFRKGIGRAVKNTAIATASLARVARDPDRSRREDGS